MGGDLTGTDESACLGPGHPRDMTPHFRKKLAVIRCTRGSGPCGLPKCECGASTPGGALSPIAQKIVEALKTQLPLGPGWTVAV